MQTTANYEPVTVDVSRNAPTISVTSVPGALAMPRALNRIEKRLEMSYESEIISLDDLPIKIDSLV
jgi:hypothetical protein